jgi:hypothetical protein
MEFDFSMQIAGQSGQLFVLEDGKDVAGMMATGIRGPLGAPSISPPEIEFSW